MLSANYNLSKENTVETFDDVKDVLFKIKARLDSLDNRILDIESDVEKNVLLRLTHLTPTNDLEDVKRTINYIVNYINGGRGHDTRIFNK